MAEHIRRTTMVNPLARGIGNYSINLRAGAAFGGYRLIKPLGAGGEGEVWKTLDAQGKQTILKIDKRPVISLNKPVETSALEVIAAAGGHQAIVGMLGAGIEAGSHFRALEYIEGHDLLEELSQVEEINGFGLSLRRSLEVLRHATDGLLFIHRLGLIHRDVKMENIMISKDGEVKIIDLGLASNFPVVSDVGTVVYFSPERLQGEAIGPQADIFSLGVVFYTMLTREHPFATRGLEEQDSMTLVRMLKNKISFGIYSFPKPIRSLIKGMLAHSPEKRFRTCEEIIQAVDLASASLPKEESRWERFFRKTAWRVLMFFDRIRYKLPSWLSFSQKQ